MILEEHKKETGKSVKKDIHIYTEEKERLSDQKYLMKLQEIFSKMVEIKS